MSAGAIQRRPFGSTSPAAAEPGAAVELLELDAGAGVVATLCTYGARLWSVRAPDRAGAVDELTLNLSSLTELEARDRWFGATVGRYANRLGGTFAVDGVRSDPEPNEGSTCLHGGPVGFDRHVWSVLDLAPTGPVGPTVVLGHVSDDGDQGFRGRLTVTLTATLRDRALHLVHEAVTDAPTVVSLTNHAWWNLAGADATSVREHTVSVPAARRLPLDERGLPTSDPVGVTGTAYDLRAPSALASLLDALPDGLDDCYLPEPAPDTAPGGRRWVARLAHAGTGRTLEVESDQPALQVYTAGDLDGAAGRDGPLVRFGAVCLEPQQLPDAPRHHSWTSPALRPGETYRHHLVLRLGVEG